MLHGNIDGAYREISPPEEKNNYTYILHCNDGTFYTGWTNDLAGRVATHNAGAGGKYTRVRLPVALVFYAVSESRQKAMQLEWRIKQLSRTEKERLVRGALTVEAVQLRYAERTDSVTCEGSE